MKFRFKYTPTTLDLWKLSMRSIYSSMVGVVNIIFTLAMIGLVVRFWMEAKTIYRLLMILGISLFTLIQPMVIYRKSKGQIEAIPKGMEIGFDDRGIHIITSLKTSRIRWKEVKRVMKMNNMVIILMISNQGFIITDEMVGGQKEDFYKFLDSKTG